MTDFEKKIGFKFLKGVHLNDSKNDYETKKDRHESIGKGFLGIEPFQYIMQDPRFDDIPMVLDTPYEANCAEEIKKLHGLCN